MTALHRLALSTVALCACGGAKPAGDPGESASGGPSITTLATQQGYPIHIGGDAGGLFWTNHLGGQVVGDVREDDRFAFA